MVKGDGGGGDGGGSGSGGSGGGGGGGSGGGSGGSSGGGVKNTRRRNNQKRTRNTTHPKTNTTEIKPTPVLLKPVLESTNPFFIAVCDPDSYKPAVRVADGLYSPRNSSDFGVGNGCREQFSFQRQKPNVFLRHSSNNGNSGNNNYNNNNNNNNYNNYNNNNNNNNRYTSVNHFIHNPKIHNDRQRGIMTETGGSGGGGGGSGGGGGYNKHTNLSANLSVSLDDREHFPLLSSTASVSSASASASSSSAPKLNFKEMIMKNVGGSAGPEVVKEEAIIPKVRTEYLNINTPPQKALSSENIFLAAFYGSNNNASGFDDDGGGDDGGDGGDGYEGTPPIKSTSISSVLIDSCDRKYDSLYR
jgi:hypothetical protein